MQTEGMERNRNANNRAKELELWRRRQTEIKNKSLNTLSITLWDINLINTLLHSSSDRNAMVDNSEVQGIYLQASRYFTLYLNCA